MKCSCFKIRKVEVLTYKCVDRIGRLRLVYRTEVANFPSYVTPNETTSIYFTFLLFTVVDFPPFFYGDSKWTPGIFSMNPEVIEMPVLSFIRNPTYAFLGIFTFNTIKHVQNSLSHLMLTIHKPYDSSST